MSRSTVSTLARLVVGSLAVLVVIRLTRRNRFFDTPAHPGPTTHSTGTANPADADLGVAGDNQEARLDEALQESFPGSDPVSIRIE